MTKPSSCDGCSLKHAGRGFVKPSGPPAAKLLFVGESPGAAEVASGVPFVGDAGGKLTHLHYRLGRDRSTARIHNVLSCQPPGNDFRGDWTSVAVAHCAPNLDAVLAEGHLVVVALGAEPARNLLGLPDAGIKDLHGTVVRRRFAGSPRDSFVVSTFHPSHLVRGAHNLTGTVLFDLNRAYEVLDAGDWAPEQPTLYCDPSPEFFQRWVDQYFLELDQAPDEVWLAVDVETPDKQTKADEQELKSSVDRSMKILRINFSYRTDEGLTVPFCEPYTTIMRPLLEGRRRKDGAHQQHGILCFWNKPYDLKRLLKHFRMDLVRCLDFMDGWKALHSDTPRGLGFVAPFYSTWGPWKHLSGSNAVLYAAGDSLQTIRCAFGIAGDLYSEGRWDVFWRHMHEFGVYATAPSCEVGLKVDRKILEGHLGDDGTWVPGMRENLHAEAAKLFEAMQSCVPDDLKPLHPKDGWVTKPEDDFFIWPKPEEGVMGSRPREVITRIQRRPGRRCLTCGATSRVTPKHRCKDPETGKPSKTLVAKVEAALLEIPIYYVREDFNPASPVQVMAYVKAMGHKPGRDKGKENVNRDTIERLADGKPSSKRDHQARDLYHHLLDYRDIKKVQGTYVEGTLRRLALDREAGITDDRLHPTVTNNPSTLRTAMSDPNLQNVVADRRGGASLSAGFRRAVVAETGCKLVELDWSSIEAVIVGWCMGDPGFIKKAWTGVHDWVTAAVVGKPIPEDLPIDETIKLLSQIKEQEDVPGGRRDPVKRVVHGTNYLLTPFGMAKRFRKLFASQAIAEDLQNKYYAFAGPLGPWQQQTMELANRQEYLGGAGAHPFGYKHEFYSVREFRKITEAQAHRYKRLHAEGSRVPAVSNLNGTWYAVEMGDDARRSVAFAPQSIAAGIIRETSLLLFKPGESMRLYNKDWYIGDMFHGRTPLRAIIHDSFLLEVLARYVEELVAKVSECMTRPIHQLPCPEAWGLGPYLQFGVAVKVGDNWAETKKMKVPQPWLELLREMEARKRGDNVVAGNFGGSLGEGVDFDSIVDEEFEEEEGEDLYAVV